MLSEDQIKKIIELQKEEMVLINRKVTDEKNDTLNNAERIDVERINIRLREIEEELAKIKDLPRPITRDQLARELEVSNRTENEIIDEHTNRTNEKRLQIEEQVRNYINDNDLN